MFLDERGAGLRVTWHPERDLVVLSVWQGDRCVGTFRMSVQDVPRLSGLLAAALGDWVDQAPDPGGPRGLGATGLGLGAPGGAGNPGSSDPGAGAPGAGSLGPGAGAPGAGRDPGPSGGGAGGGGVGLSVQRRIRLSRPVLKLRGIQHRRRRSG
jgi:hypothetical protein